MSKITVRDVMSSPIEVIRDTATIREAAQKMIEGGIGSLIVVNDEGEAVGIVTERDVVRAVAEGVDTESPVSTIASEELVTIEPTTSVLKALEVMKAHGIRHLPIVEEDEIVGLVSLRDLAFAAAAEMLISRLLHTLKEELE